MVEEIIGLENLNETLKNNETVLVDVWAPWCGPCKMIAPIVEQVALMLHMIRMRRYIIKLKKVILNVQKVRQFVMGLQCITNFCN